SRGSRARQPRVRRGARRKQMNAPVAEPFVEGTYLAPRFGLIGCLRRVREDQLSTLGPEVFDRNLLQFRVLFLHTFLVIKPDYIERVLLTHHSNYGKSNFVRHLLGPLLGKGLFISEGETWRRQRRIAAPAFHNRRVADFVATMSACAEATLARWRTIGQPFDVAAEMMALTLDVIARTMFSTDVRGEVAAVRRLMDIVIALRPGVLDLLGLPERLPRRQPAAYR